MQDIYRDEMLKGLPGMPADSGLADIITLINDNPRTKQVDTITVDTATNSHTYTLKVNGITISFTADASATTTEVATGLAAALNAEPLVNGLFIAESSSADVTITARVGGAGWTISDVDAKCSLVNTTADDDADPVGFGLAVLRDLVAEKHGRIAKTANLKAQVATLTPTLTGTNHTVTITVGDATYSAIGTTSAAADAQARVEAVNTAINAVMPASTVISTEDNTKVTLTAEVAGQPFGVGYSVEQFTLANSSKDKFCDINQAMAGVSVANAAVEPNSSGVVQYAANSAMSVMRKGRIMVTTEDEVTETSDVYVRLSGTGTVGAFRGSADTGCVKLDPGVARWERPLSSTLAVLQCNFN